MSAAAAAPAVLRTKAGIIQNLTMLPGETLADFRKMYAGLSEADRLELAQSGAKVLGLTQSQVDFPLS